MNCSLFKQIRIPFTQGCFVPSLVEIGPVVPQEDFKLFRCIFCTSLLSPLAKGMAIQVNWLEPPSPKDAFCQVWLKLAQWFWRRRFLNFVNVLLLFRKYLHLEMGMALHLTKLESPSHHDAFCQVLLKLAQWFWRRRFLNFINVFSLFHNCLPLENLNKLESPSPRDLSLIHIWRCRRYAVCRSRWSPYH